MEMLTVCLLFLGVLHVAFIVLYSFGRLLFFDSWTRTSDRPWIWRTHQLEYNVEKIKEEEEEVGKKINITNKDGEGEKKWFCETTVTSDKQMIVLYVCALV